MAFSQRIFLNTSMAGHLAASSTGEAVAGHLVSGGSASPEDAEATAPQQYRSFSVRLALSLVSLRPWGVCDCQAGDDYSLAPRWVSGVLALAITQPCWQTDDFG
jgi:hypothetical protein